MINPETLSWADYNKIFNYLTDRQLFDIVRDNNPGHFPVDLDQLYLRARIQLFTRRGKEASSYQNSFLGSWLKHWSTAKKLSFIENDADKKAWLDFLDAALRDPLSSYEHKIRCCLFINKLFPDIHDITPDIIQHILLDASNNKSVANIFKAFASEFSKDNIELLLRSLLAQRAQLNDINWRIRHDAASVLGNMAPHIPQPERIAMVQPLIDKLNDGSWRVRRAAASALGNIAPHVLETQRIAMVQPLIGKLSDEDPDVREAAASALGNMAPHIPQPERIAMVQPLIDKLNDGNWRVRQAAASALGLIAPHVLETQRIAIVTALIDTLNDEDPDVWQAAAQTLAELVPTLSNKQLQNLLKLPGARNTEKMVLQLIAQTRVHMNHLVSLPQQHSGVYFSPKVGDKSVAEDDHLNEVPYKKPHM